MKDKDIWTHEQKTENLSCLVRQVSTVERIKRRTMLARSCTNCRRTIRGNDDNFWIFLDRMQLAHLRRRINQPGYLTAVESRCFSHGVVIKFLTYSSSAPQPRQLQPNPRKLKLLNSFHTKHLPPSRFSRLCRALAQRHFAPFHAFKNTFIIIRFRTSRKILQRAALALHRAGSLLSEAAI